MDRVDRKLARLIRDPREVDPIGRRFCLQRLFDRRPVEANTRLGIGRKDVHRRAALAKQCRRRFQARLVIAQQPNHARVDRAGLGCDLGHKATHKRKARERIANRQKSRAIRAEQAQAFDVTDDDAGGVLNHQVVHDDATARLGARDGGGNGFGGSQQTRAPRHAIDAERQHRRVKLFFGNRVRRHLKTTIEQRGIDETRAASGRAHLGLGKTRTKAHALHALVFRSVVQTEALQVRVEFGRGDILRVNQRRGSQRFPVDVADPGDDVAHKCARMFAPWMAFTLRICELGAVHDDGVAVLFVAAAFQARFDA